MEIGRGNPKKALSYTQCMRALPKPQDFAWNARRKYYGWLGEHLHCMALRAVGRHHEANAIESNNFALAGKKISLCHATRGRPAQAFKTRADWFDAADNPDAIEHIFAIDPDDETVEPLLVCKCVANTGMGSVPAWNEAARASQGKVLVQLSDDWLPFKGWDTAILNAIGDLDEEKVLAVSDGGRRDDLLCMAILTRHRWERQGKNMFHPDFFSVFSDNWFTDCAIRDGVLVGARDKIQFEHMHPAFGKAQMDSTYMRGNSEAAYRTGFNHYERLKSGKITSHDVEGWCNYRPFYTKIAEQLANGDTFVEVGSWLGQSIIHFCQRCQDLGKPMNVVCVDTFKGEEGQTAHLETVEKLGGKVRAKFEDNIAKAGVADMIRIIEGDSAQSALHFGDGSIGGVYIDAAHDYQSVRRDLAAWWPKVRAGGVFSGHDYHWHEVRQAVQEHAKEHGWEIGVVGNVWFRMNK